MQDIMYINVVFNKTIAKPLQPHYKMQLLQIVIWQNSNVIAVQ